MSRSVFAVNCVVSAILSAVILAELFHLVTDHYFLPKDMELYQQALLVGLRETVRVVKSSATKEELIRNFGAEYIGQMTKEDVLRLPRCRQGRYKDVECPNGDLIPLDWEFYEIDPICDYRGVLEVGLSGGCFKEAHVEYTFCEGD